MGILASRRTREDLSEVRQEDAEEREEVPRVRQRHVTVTKIRKTGKTDGKSNRLGYGGRAAQLKAQGVPQAVIGQLARKAQAAPGQRNYHGKKGK